MNCINAMICPINPLAQFFSDIINPFIRLINTLTHGTKLATPKVHASY